MYCNRKIACCKPQCCLLIARAFTFVNEQTVLLRPFFRSKNREKRVGFPKIRTFLGSETASAGSKKTGKSGLDSPKCVPFQGQRLRLRGQKTGSRQSLSPPLRMARKGFMKWNACVDHSDSPARINLVVKVFLCFLIILSPTHNHASLEMSDEPEGLPVRDEVASIVTMLQCYMLHVTLRVRLTSSLHHPKKNRSSITPQRECEFFVRFLAQGCKVCTISCRVVQGCYFIYLSSRVS